MFKNLLKISWRNLLKDKLYTILNVFGLTVGFTFSIFLLLYIIDELSYDKFHNNYQNTYRVISNIQETDNQFSWAVTQIPFAKEVQSKYEEVESVVRFTGTGELLLEVGEDSFTESDLLLADSNFFDVFTYEVLSGSLESALNEPNSLVLTEDLAIKLFGSINCLGETVHTNQDDDLSVMAVIENAPDNSHFDFTGLISLNSVEGFRGSWGNFGVPTYVVLQDGYDYLQFQEKLMGIIEEHVNPIFESLNIRIEYELQPIANIHLHSKTQGEEGTTGDMSYIYIFLVVAIFLVLIASINYMNMATARSIRRAKEVGIRKVVGSSKRQLVTQFMSESVLVTLFSFFLSVVLIFILIPVFNELSNKSFEWIDFFQTDILLAAVLIVIATGLLGGVYPSLVLSSFKPVTVLSGGKTTGGGHAFIRKALVVFQFVITVFMLISTLVVYDQMQYLRDKDLGYNREHVIRIELSDDELRENYEVIRNACLQLPEVKNVASTSSRPGSGYGKVIFEVQDNEGVFQQRGIDFLFIDYDYVPLMEMEVVQGRNFDRKHPSDTTFAVLVNEAMTERFSWDEPLGKIFKLPGQDTVVNAEVIGVLKDFHQNSLYTEIEPLMIRFGENNYNLMMRVNGENIPETMAKIEDIWMEINPDHPFKYDFMDELYENLYKADAKRGVIFSIFSVITIFIACLGLLALISFTAEQKVKEIGLRKVLGASTMQLILFLTRQFLLLVLIATVIAFPLAWYFTDEWLTTFAYRIELTQEIPTFIISAVIALVITVLTTLFHSWKASSANPVNSLRNE